MRDALETELMSQQIQTLKAQEVQAYAQARWEARKHFISGIAAGAAVATLALKAFGAF